MSYWAISFVVPPTALADRIRILIDLPGENTSHMFEFPYKSGPLDWNTILRTYIYDTTKMNQPPENPETNKQWYSQYRQPPPHENGECGYTKSGPWKPVPEQKVFETLQRHYKGNAQHAMFVLNNRKFTGGPVICKFIVYQYM